MEFIHQPSGTVRLGDFLKSNLSGPWHTFRAAVAFAKRSGTRHVCPSLQAFAPKRRVQVIVGIDHHGTSKEGLEDLLQAIPPGGVTVFHNRIPATFHPKLYLFRSDDAAEIVVGSGNLTEGGLFSNYEASVRHRLDLCDAQNLRFLDSVETQLDTWADLASGTALILDVSLLTRLVALGLVPPESLSSPEGSHDKIEAGDHEDYEGIENPFKARPVPHAPRSPQPSAEGGFKSGGADLFSAVASVGKDASALGFVLTLQQTDVGVGQVTAGTSARSPEIFIPLAARDANPEFWGWPNLFVPEPGWAGERDRDGRGKMDRPGVIVRFGGENLSVAIWYNPDKRDVRLRSSAIRNAGNVGDILRMEKVNSTEYEYYVEIVPQGTTQHPVYLDRCTTPVRNSRKRFGYY